MGKRVVSRWTFGPICPWSCVGSEVPQTRWVKEIFSSAILKANNRWVVHVTISFSMRSCRATIIL